MVSVPAIVSVSEEDGSVQICATLLAITSTDVPVSITLTTVPGLRAARALKSKVTMVFVCTYYSNCSCWF